MLLSELNVYDGDCLKYLVVSVGHFNKFLVINELQAWSNISKMLFVLVCLNPKLYFVALIVEYSAGETTTANPQCIRMKIKNLYMSVLLSI